MSRERRKKEERRFDNCGKVFDYTDRKIRGGREVSIQVECNLPEPSPKQSSCAGIVPLREK